MEMARRHDFAFLNLHGSPGEDGLVQALLNAAGCPYQGSGPEASFFWPSTKPHQSKYSGTAAWSRPTGSFWWRSRALPGGRASTSLAFFKPNTGGSSLGMSLVRHESELPAALNSAFAEGREVLVEPALDGPEVTCAVLGQEALPPILIRPKACVFFDYQSKYCSGRRPRKSARPPCQDRSWTRSGAPRPGLMSCSAFQVTAAPTSSCPGTPRFCWKSTPCPA